MKSHLYKTLSALAAVILVFNIFTFSVSATSDATLSSEELTVVRLINEQRMANDLKPLSVSVALQQAAHIRVKEAAYLFSHTRPNGTGFQTAIRQTSYPLAYCWQTGENIARGQTSAQATTDGWMNSTAHRNNILTPAFSHTGVGYTEKNETRLQLFAGTTSGTECKYTNMQIYGDSLKSSYPAGTEIDRMDLILSATCETHGDCIIPVTHSMCCGYSPAKTGDQLMLIDTGYGMITLQIHTAATTASAAEAPRTTVCATTAAPTAATQKAPLFSFSFRLGYEPPSKSQTQAAQTEPQQESVLHADNPNIRIDETHKYCILTQTISPEDFQHAFATEDTVSIQPAFGNEIGTGTTILAGSQHTPYTCILCGDLDGNARINSSDARSVLRASAKIDALTDITSIAADENIDGKVNSSDARLILRIAAKLS